MENKLYFIVDSFVDDERLKRRKEEIENERKTEIERASWSKKQSFVVANANKEKNTDRKLV